MVTDFDERLDDYEKKGRKHYTTEVRLDRQKSQLLLEAQKEFNFL